MPQGTLVLPAHTGDSLWRKAASALAYQTTLTGVAYTISVTASGSLINITQSSLNTDDIPLNLALVYISALGGGEFYIDEGDYNITEPLDYLSDSTVITGSGRNTLIDGDLLANNEHAIQIDSYDNCAVRNLSIQTADGSGNTSFCIYAVNANNLHIIMVFILDCALDAIYYYGSTPQVTRDLWITECRIEDADRDGIRIVTLTGGIYGVYISKNYIAPTNIGINNPAGSPIGAYWHITNNDFTTSTLGIDIALGMGPQVYFSTIIGNTFHDLVNGIRVRYGFIVSGNIGYTGTGYFITVTGSICIITDNEGYTFTGDGIIVSGSNNKLNDNYLYDCSDGIEISGSDNEVHDNTLVDNNAYGINLTAFSSGNRVLDNTFSGNASGNVNDLGSSNVFHTIEWLVTYGTAGISLAGDVPVAAITNGQSAAVGFECPPNLQQLIRAKLKVLPNATQATANWDLYSDYGGVGQAPNTHSESDTTTTYNVTNNQWYDIELIALGFFANLSIGDRGGIRILVSTVGHNVSVFSLMFEYV